MKALNMRRNHKTTKGESVQACHILLTSHPFNLKTNPCSYPRGLKGSLNLKLRFCFVFLFFCFFVFFFFLFVFTWGRGLRPNNGSCNRGIMEIVTGERNLAQQLVLHGFFIAAPHFYVPQVLPPFWETGLYETLPHSNLQTNLKPSEIKGKTI